jgi:hypothetical protein
MNSTYHEAGTTNQEARRKTRRARFIIMEDGRPLLLKMSGWHWSIFDTMAGRPGRSPQYILQLVDDVRQHEPLASAVQSFLLGYYLRYAEI